VSAAGQTVTVHFIQLNRREFQKKKKSTGWRDGAGGIGGTAPVPVAAPVRHGIAMHGPHVSVSSGPSIACMCSPSRKRM
jgi:hypothetical protein